MGSNASYGSFSWKGSLASALSIYERVTPISGNAVTIARYNLRNRSVTSSACDNSLLGSLAAFLDFTGNAGIADSARNTSENRNA
jgi:hypothetical protein